MTKPPVVASGSLQTAAMACLLAVAVVCAFGNGWRGPFVFDDHIAIVENSSLRRLGAIDDERAAAPTSGRPVVNFTFALNFAAHGLDVEGYHVVNILLHVVVGCVLFDFLRRTLLLLPAYRELPNRAAAVAAAVTVLWALHPLNVEAVTYVSQRTELLFGLFYLLTLDAACLAFDSPHARAWSTAAVAFCLLGMACKETMVTAPLMVVLYDLAFRPEPWGETWRRRRGLYAALAATWLYLVYSVGWAGRAVLEGEGRHAWTLWDYLRTQAWAIGHYVRLAIWPTGQCTDYGEVIVTDPAVYVPAGLLILAAIGLAVRAWIRGPRPAAFLASWFFLILAPTSSVLIISSEPVAERRMYLPLVALLAGAAVAGDVGLRRVERRRPAARSLAVAAVLLLAAAGVAAVHDRNRVYQSELAFWTDAVERSPHSSRGHHGLATCYLKLGDLDRAEAEFERSAALKPLYGNPQISRATMLHRRGRLDEALREFDAALARQPNNAKIELMRTNVLIDSGRFPEAERAAQSVVEREPHNTQSLLVLATVYISSGDFDQAERYLVRAYDLDPARKRDVQQLRERMYRQPSTDDLQRAVAADPHDADSYRRLAKVHEQSQRYDGAEQAYRAGIAALPNDDSLRNSFGGFLVRRGRIDEARYEFGETIRLNPNHAEALNNLGILTARGGDFVAARRLYERAIQADRQYAAPHSNLGNLAAREGRLPEAAAHYEAALAIDVNFADARRNLEAIRGRNTQSPAPR